MFRAQGLTQRFAPNRNLALPARPALVADLIPLRLPQGSMAYLGSTAPILLNGRSVNELLPGLLPLLRGDLDAAAVPDRAGPSLRPAVDDLLHFLFARGLLVEHDEQPLLDSAAMRRHALFFERYCSELSLASGARPAQRLRDGQVLVVGGGHELAPLQDALSDLGVQIRTVAIDGLTGVTPTPTPSPADAPVLALATPATLARLTPQQLAWAAVQGWRWLPLQTGRQCLTVGPVVRDGTEPCVDCLGAANAPHALTDPALWTAAAHLVLMVLADATTGHWGVNRLRIDAATLDWHSEGHARQPACQRCGCGAQAAATGFAATYHLNTQDQPLRGSARQHLISYEPAQVDKVRGAAKPYNGAHWRWDAPQAADGNALGQLLAWAGQCLLWQHVGGQGPMRPVPSAGNLASQSLYLVNLHPGDPRAGVHYLHPDGRAFCVAPAAQALPFAEALGGAQAGLVATAAVARLESKYGHKAYRFAHYDAGVMLAALQALAREQRLELLCSANLDDTALDTLLGLDGHTELVCWLATLPSSCCSPARTPETDEVTTP